MAAAPNLLPGSVFAGDFRVDRTLSSGGMGVVYVARQLSTGRDRALKLMLGELADNRDLTRRFEQEARIGAQIDSEHVVEVVAAGVDAASGAPWLAMELLQGGIFAGHLRRVGAVPPAVALELFEQLAHALGAAHDNQIVHRDLKPENIFLAKPRRAGASFTLKVLDFGIAKLMNQARTSATGAMGTPLWMAPEQAQAGSQITPAADVWALGLIVFRALCGRCFWKAASDADSSALMVMREVLMDTIPAASQRARDLDCPSLPQGFDDWFRRCVDRDPSARFPNGRIAFEELRPILAAQSTTGARPSGPQNTIAAGPLTSFAPPQTVGVADANGSQRPAAQGFTEIASAADLRAATPPAFLPAKRGGKGGIYVAIGATTALIVFVVVLANSGSTSQATTGPGWSRPTTLASSNPSPTSAAFLATTSSPTTAQGSSSRSPESGAATTPSRPPGAARPAGQAGVQSCTSMADCGGRECAYGKCFSEAGTARFHTCNKEYGICDKTQPKGTNCLAVAASKAGCRFGNCGFESCN